MLARLATSADAASIAGIYNQAIEDRSATFETALRTEDEILAWFDGAHPVVVVEDDAALVVAFARASDYRPRDCYRGVFEFAVYTDHLHRRRGAGALAMRELVTQARAAGARKLLSRIFVENEGSRALVASLGFREVGTYYRHAKLDGRWRDVIIVEKFLAPIVAEAAIVPGVQRDELLRSLRSDTLEERVLALDGARHLVDRGTEYPPEKELLEVAVDAFFMAKVHEPGARGKFVELFRAYASLSPDTAQDFYRALFTRLERWSIARELDAFYEALFVVKQVAFGSESTRVLDLAAHVPLLLRWMEQAVELPPQLRTRISPGNVTSLLMTLATAGCESEDQKRHVTELAAEAKARHRVEPPTSLRPPAPPSQTIAVGTPIESAPAKPKKKRAKRALPPNDPAAAAAALGEAPAARPKRRRAKR